VRGRRGRTSSAHAEHLVLITTCSALWSLPYTPRQPTGAPRAPGGWAQPRRQIRSIPLGPSPGEPGHKPGIWRRDHEPLPTEIRQRPGRVVLSFVVDDVDAAHAEAVNRSLVDRDTPA